MTRAHCRIGKVRLKAHPSVSVLTPQPSGLGEEHLFEMHQHLDTVWGNLEDDGLAGIVIVGFDLKGHYTRATKVHVKSPIGKTLLPNFIAEVLRCDKTRDIADEAIDERVRF